MHFEEDRNVFDSSMVPREDFFYWDYVIAGTNANSLKQFPIDLTGAVGDVALTVRLMGWSSPTITSSKTPTTWRSSAERASRSPASVSAARNRTWRC